MTLPKTELRDYQINALDFLSRNQHEDCLIQLPTGTGKTVIIAAIVAQNVSQGKKTLILVPSQELVDNITSRISMGLTVGIYSGKKPDPKLLPHYNTMVITYQSVKNYFDKFLPHTIISDEAHLSMSPTWKNAIAQIKIRDNSIRHIGFTATPNRLDGLGLSHHYSKMLESPQISWFIERGHLSDFQLVTRNASFLSGTSNDALDLQEKKFLPEIKSTIDVWLNEASTKQTLFFVPTVKYGQKLNELLLERGFNSQFLSANTDKNIRKIDFTRFKNGELQILINVELFTLGVDVPDCECVVLNRFTYSTALYLQMTGRLLRPSTKQKLLIDLANNVYYHGSPKTSFYWSLEGDSKAPSSNSSSTYVKCSNDACGAVLTHKKHVWDVSEICCLKCHETTLMIPISTDDKRSRTRLQNVFSAEQLHRINDHTITEFSRAIFNGKLKRDTRIRTILQVSSVDISLKVKALKYLKVPESEIEMYIDREYW